MPGPGIDPVSSSGVTLPSRNNANQASLWTRALLALAGDLDLMVLLAVASIRCNTEPIDVPDGDIPIIPDPPDAGEVDAAPDAAPVNPDLGGVRNLINQQLMPVGFGGREINYFWALRDPSRTDSDAPGLYPDLAVTQLVDTHDLLFSLSTDNHVFPSYPGEVLTGLLPLGYRTETISGSPILVDMSDPEDPVYAEQRLLTYRDTGAQVVYVRSRDLYVYEMQELVEETVVRRYYATDSAGTAEGVLVEPELTADDRATIGIVYSPQLYQIERLDTEAGPVFDRVMDGEAYVLLNRADYNFVYLIDPARQDEFLLLGDHTPLYLAGRIALHDEQCGDDPECYYTIDPGQIPDIADGSLSVIVPGNRIANYEGNPGYYYLTGGIGLTVDQLSALPYVYAANINFNYEFVERDQ